MCWLLANDYCTEEELDFAISKWKNFFHLIFGRDDEADDDGCKNNMDKEMFIVLCEMLIVKNEF